MKAQKTIGSDVQVESWANQKANLARQQRSLAGLSLASSAPAVCGLYELPNQYRNNACLPQRRQPKFQHQACSVGP